MGLAISSFTEINTLWLMLIMSVCGAIGLVGLGRIHDQMCIRDSNGPPSGGTAR